MSTHVIKMELADSGSIRIIEDEDTRPLLSILFNDELYRIEDSNKLMLGRLALEQYLTFRNINKLIVERKTERNGLVVLYDDPSDSNTQTKQSTC